MKTQSQAVVAKSTSSFFRQVILPACILFTAVVFVFFVAAILTDTPVTDKQWEFYETYNGESDTDNSTTQTFSDPQNNALSISMLFGILLFSASVAALTLVKRLGYGALLTSLIHFVGSAVAFFVFVMLMGGYFADAGFGPAMAGVVVFAIGYWLVIGVKSLLFRITGSVNCTHRPVLSKYVPVIFGVFTVILFVLTIYSLVGGEYFGIKVTTKINVDSYWTDDRVQETSYVTIVNPLTPTVNNYLRYLGTAAVLVIGIAILFTKLNVIAKVFINFAVITAGLILIWPLQLDYFKLPALSDNVVVAAVSYLSVYLATLVLCAVILFIRRRKREDEEDYVSQFSVAKKKNKDKDQV